MKYHSALILISVVGALARPAQDVLEISKHRPLVIWHGLGQSALLQSLFSYTHERTPTGDSYDSSGIVKFQSYVEEMYPGIFIHSVNIDPNSKKDRRATFVRSQLVPPSPSIAFTTTALFLHNTTNSTEMLTSK
jgi:hypothetical protein